MNNQFKKNTVKIGILGKKPIGLVLSTVVIFKEIKPQKLSTFDPSNRLVTPKR